jgi:hypothetical protein
VEKMELVAVDWQAGYDAGQARKPNRPPQGVDGLSWTSGYIEGKAQPWDPGAGEQDLDPDHGPGMR